MKQIKIDPKFEVKQKEPPKRYVVTCSEGHPIGFYSSDIHGGNIPPSAKSITEEQYNRFHEGQCAPEMKRHRFVNGDMVVHEGVLTPVARARVAEGAGLTISFNGKSKQFPTDREAQFQAIRGLAAIGANGALLSDKGTVLMADSKGEVHHFSPKEYQSVAGAILSYAVRCGNIADGISKAELPPQKINLKL